jgi:hypothetical protein
MYAKLFEALLQGRVDFLVLGGSAVCLHGYPRMTTDINILLENSTENIARFLSVTGKWGAGWAASLHYEDFQGPGAVRIIEDFPLDVFTLEDGRPYADFAKSAAIFSIGNGVDVACFSIPDLIEVKKGTLREKDQLDVTVLRRLQSESPLTGVPRTILLESSSQPDETSQGQAGG